MLIDAEIMAQNRNPRWLPSAILDFQNLIFEHWDPRTADFPSLYQIWRKNVDRRRNYGPKSKSRMAAVRHLGFVTSSYRITHKVFSLGHIGPSNFMLIRCIVLKIWRIEIFADLAWNAYIFTPQKFWFWGAKIGDAIFGFRPQPNQFFRFRPQRFFPNFVKIGWNATVSVPTDTYIHTYIHTHIYTQTSKNWFDNLSHAMV